MSTDTGFDKNDFDITGNIKTIEKLKSDLLANVSNLHVNLLEPQSSLAERGDILAELVIAAYVLSGRLGIAYETLDEQILKKLKLLRLDERSTIHADMTYLFKHIEKNRT